MNNYVYKDVKCEKCGVLSSVLPAIGLQKLSLKQIEDFEKVNGRKIEPSDTHTFICEKCVLDVLLRR